MALPWRFLRYRLRKATGREILYRLREQAFVRALEYGWVRPPKAPDVSGAFLQGLRLSAGTAPVDRETLDWVLRGGRFCLGEKLERIRAFEVRWQGTFFSRVAADGQAPDIRSVWEPSRMRHVLVLLDRAAANPAERERLCRQARGEVLGWIARNPFLFGPHYMSVMECALRIPVFLRVLKEAGPFPEREQRDLLQSLYAQAWLTDHRLSLFSSLGNHTVAECVGLVHAGVLFQGDARAGRWLQRGIQLLEQECRHQIHADGGPAEQSLNYHRFVLDLFVQAAFLLEKNGLRDTEGMERRVENGRAFGRAFEYAPGQAPSLGDSDDAAPLGHSGGSGSTRERAGEDEVADALALRHFPDTGYTILTGRSGLFLAFNHGPLGMPPLYNHGHADALQILLSLQGVPFLVDPGTYRYNGVPEWRRYFRGTRAHNTVCVDGLDQARQASAFAWEGGYCAVSHWGRADGRLLLSALHDGYERLGLDVVHQRTLKVSPGRVRVKDVFRGSGDHTYALHYHLHPGVVASREAEGFRLEHQGRRLRIHLEGGTLEQGFGRRNPLLGWYSPSYGKLQPAPYLAMSATGRPGDCVFTTIMEWDSNNENAGSELSGAAM